MKALKNRFLFLWGLLLFLSFPGLSQEFTLREKEEIAHQAQQTLRMYNDLLNVISYEGLATESEVEELIRNSYSPSRSQIFYSDEVIIEDNSTPSRLGRQYKQDKTVKNYLRHFDLTYEKAAKASIDFFDYELSNLKFSNYPYIQIKYTSHFKGKHKEDPSPYRAVERVAEFRAERRDNKWKTFISSIVYYDPEKPLKSTVSNAKLDRSAPAEGTFTHLTEKMRKGQGDASYDAKPSGESVRLTEEQDSLFNSLMKAGEAALSADKPDEALVAFVEAEKINPYHQGLRQNLQALGKRPVRREGSVENRFELAKQMAEEAFSSREYSRAKNFYSEALRLKPGEDKIKVEIEKLERIIRKLAMLESRYSVGEYKEAIREYSRAIRKDRDNPDYYYGRGKSYEKLNEPEEALQDYSRAIELDGSFVEALRSRAGLYAKTGKYHEAIADYTLILSNPAYAATYYPERAGLKVKMGDIRGAIEDYNAAIRQNPEMAGLYFGKGMIFFDQENWSEAIKAFSQAIAKDPEHGPSFLQRGLAFAASGNLQEASSDFEKAGETGLEEDQLTEINRLSLQYYKKAEGAMVEESYTQALKSFKDALLISPAFARAWLRAGDAYMQLEEYDSALVYYDRAIEYEPVSFGWFKRGLALQQKGESRQALEDFRKYIPVGKELLARTKQEKEGTKSTASRLRSFVEEGADVYYALGYSQLMTREIVEALENLDMAIHARKFFPRAWFARGSAFYALENYKSAVKNMEESIRMGLSEPIVFYSLGKAYMANDQLKDAIFSFSHTIELDPEYEEAYRERAFCYKSFGQYGLALEDIKTALSLNRGLEKDAALVAQRGLLQLYLNRLPEARQSFEQALRLDKNEGWALYGMAGVLAQENKMKKSLELYKKAFQSRQLNWAAIKKDPLLDPVREQKEFRDLVKAYL